MLLTQVNFSINSHICGLICTNCNVLPTCRKRGTQEDAGPSQPKKQKKKKKKSTPKKKKTPAKKKLKKAQANPAPTVVSSIRKLVFEGQTA